MKKQALNSVFVKFKIKASGPITSWQIDGEKWKLTDFIFLGSRITGVTSWHGDYSRELKRCLLLGRKGMTNLDSIPKSKDITLSIKVHIVKTMVFPGVMYKFRVGP